MHSGLSPTTKIEDVKQETLSALQANVAQNALDVLAMDPPEIYVQTTDDFELCRAIKEKGGLSGNFEVLESSKKLRDCGITGWEVIFLQFRDRETGKHIFQWNCLPLKINFDYGSFFHSPLNKYLGELLPITYTLPPMHEDDREVPVSQATDIKGKRRASVELDESTLDF